MPMYNLLEYSKNYRKTTGSLFNYYRDEILRIRLIMLVYVLKIVLHLLNVLHILMMNI